MIRQAAPTCDPPDTGSLLTTRIPVAGTDSTLTYERDLATGALRSIRAGERVYLTISADGVHVFDGGFATFRESRRSDGFDREVVTPTERWRERYRWGDDGKLREVDGARIHRDDRGRVIAIIHESGQSWSYGYGARGLTTIEAPDGQRAIGREADGRVSAIHAEGMMRTVSYDSSGVRRGASRLSPRRHHRDEAGRVWTLTRADGSIESTFLWDGHRCLARIDGPVGAPLSAVFCLDPSATPVRVISRDGVRRIPRDAYGEGLLDLDRVPGLFGGMVEGGLVHLPLRAVDPLSGSFCAPDPLHGRADDVRRGERGTYTGPLATEPEQWSPYAVCRDDPVGRGDPTGGVSGWLIFSDLTWSLQNNLLSFFGIDWWFNLFFSLFTGFQLGDFGSSEGLSSSDRMGAFGVRRDGFIGHITGGRAFTTQHIVWSPAAEFELLQHTFVIDPKGTYEPTLYGTVLRARPEGDQPFLLRGMRTSGGGFADAEDWSRQGGPAAPVCPGAVAPRFPAGGFHLPNAHEILAPRPCPLEELIPGGTVAVGALEQRATMLIPLGGTIPAVDDLVLLFDADNDLVITSVVSSSQQTGRQLLRFEDDAPAVGPAGVTLTLLDNAPAGAEVRASEPAVTNGLTAVGTGQSYAPGDLLRLTSGNDVTTARVGRLEARLPLDRPLPPAMTGPIQIRRTTVAPTGQTVTVAAADRLDFSAGTTPVAPSMGLVRGTAGEVAVRVLDASNPASVQVDGDVSGVGAGTVQFFPVTAGAALGSRAEAAEAAAQVTYRPEAPGTAPDGAAGTVVLRFEGTGGPAVRRLTGPATYDAIVLDRAPAGASPWNAERFVRRGGSSDLADQQIIAAASLAVDPATATDGAAALRLDRVDATGAPPAPAAAGTLFSAFAINGAEATGSVAPGSQPGTPAPGHVVVVTGPGPSATAVVSRVRVSPTFDRPIPVEGGGILAVALQTDGFVYEAERIADDRLVVNGRAAGPGGLIEVAFPRFGVGETIEVSWAPRASGDRDCYRIAAVVGTTITLEGGAPVTAARADLRVQRLVPADSLTGSSFLARDGDAPATPTSVIEFSVWSPDAFPEGRVVGIAKGDRTWPAIVNAANQDVSIEFGADTGLAGVGDIAGVTVQASRFAGRFVRDGQVLLIVDDTTGLATSPTELLLVTAYTDSGNTAASARVSPGTLLVPEDETVEIDRRQSLTDHELAHTIQYSQWGPLWFCYFPMLVLELPVELATDAERPAYDPFFEGTITASGTFWELAASSDPGVAVDDTIQIVQGASTVSAEIREIEGRTLRLRMKESGAIPPTGAVHARRRNPSGVWSGIFDTLQFFTHGGLLNGVVGTTWGGILWCLGKLFWGLGRAIAGTGDHYPGTVQDTEQRIIRLTTPEGRSGLADATQIIIRQGEVSVVRSATLAAELLTLEQPLTFTGDVQVAPYASLDPGNAFAWFSYHPGTVADVANPFEISVPGHGGDFAAHDRVEISYRDRTFRSFVTRVNGDTIEIEDPVPLTAGETSLRIASVGAGDPMGQADSYLATELGMGWMRWIFDPWGRIDIAVGPEPVGLNVFLRIVRYLMGTQMWSLLPVLGYVFYGRFFVAEHLAKIEQEASEESGDLYTPLSRLTGEVRRTDGFGRYEMVVGDVARMRNWTMFRLNTLIDAAHQDEPGVHRTGERLRLIVDRAETGTADDPNGTVETGGTDPAAALFDRFAVKDPADPNALAGATNPLGFDPSDLGHIPDAPTTVRHVGAYAAFTRAGDHRLTVANQVERQGGPDPGAPTRSAREAQERERQTVFFDVTVRDVEVRVNGQAVAGTGPVELVHTQEALLTVAPDGADAGARRFRATVRRPDDGPVLRARNDRRLLAQAADGADEPVEVCRFYAFDTASATYTDASLAAFGVHLGGDLFVPVRRINVNVVSTIPLRATSDPTAAALAQLTQGEEGVLLVPTNVRGAATVTQFDGRAPAPGDPAVDIRRVDDPGEAARGFLGTAGSALSVRFAADPALPGVVPVVVSIPVGVPGGLASTLTATFDLAPA